MIALDRPCWAILVSLAVIRGADVAAGAGTSPASRLRMSSAPCADTVWIGHVVSATGLPGTAGGAPPYHIGRGLNRITGGGAPGTPAGSFNGVWCFDHFQAGESDTLMGWWPVTLPFASNGGVSVADRSRPFSGLDYGNQGNYVLNAASGPTRRTFGVTSYWHRDLGSGLPSSALPGTNPTPLTWTPLAGAASAWCGLRAHGDAAVVDPVTGNPFNASVLDYNGSNRGLDGPSGGSTAIQNFPGYGSQWDQMLYRDAVIASDGVSLTVTFKYRTQLSTGVLDDPGTRVGWFDKDPLKTPTAGDGNFISAYDAQANAPADSFMVYVGVPVDTSSGTARYVGSDGATYALFDRQRRWFSEVIRVNRPYVELLSLAGVKPTTTFNVTLSNAVVQPILNAQPGVGGTVRIVFRVKTNRGFDDEDNGVSGFSSGTAGAAIVDDVNVNTGGANLVAPGDFESATAINNSNAVAATAAWKSTGKPPPVFYHVHNVSDLVYQDPLGPPGSAGRVCNMIGNVVTPGDHDQGEKPGGFFGSSFQDRQDALVSPTINLRSTGPGDYNAMGIDATVASASAGYALSFDVYSNLYDYPNTGNGYRIGWQSYPALQPNGVKCWGDIQKATNLSTGPQGCFAGILGGSPGALANGLIVTSNVSGIPDSLRVYIEHVARCFALQLSSVDCSPNTGSLAGGYFDNISIGFLTACPGSPKHVNISSYGIVDLADPHPQILSSPAGVLVSAWGRRDGRVSFSRSRDGGVMFSRPRHLNGPASHPAITRTPTGRLLLAIAGVNGILCNRSENDGISFYPPVTVDADTLDVHPAIGVDAGGLVQVLWDNGSATYGASSTNSGVSFGTPQAVSSSDGAGRIHTLPQIAFDDLHDAYAIWAHAHATAPLEAWIEIARAPNPGTTYGAPVTISDVGRSAYEPQIVTRTGTVYALWIYSGAPDVVHLSSASSGSTSFANLTEVSIPGTGGTTHGLSAAVAADGTLHVVVQSSLSGTPQCFYFTRPSSGGSFTIPVNFTSTTEAAMSPAVTLDNNGFPVIVWSQQFGSGQDVFCTKP
jgi:hypothetical protein